MLNPKKPAHDSFAERLTAERPHDLTQPKQTPRGVIHLPNFKQNEDCNGHKHEQSRPQGLLLGYVLLAARPEAEEARVSGQDDEMSVRGRLV